jgi:phosphoribosylamine--glycine ligase
MRFLGIGDYCELGSMYLQLLKAGHEVRVYVGARESRKTLKGLIKRTTDWKKDLAWVRSAGPDGIILFETADAGDTQDRLRAEGYNVVGGSAFGDRLESDRAFGQGLLRKAGVQTAATIEFTSFEDGISHIQRHPARYVYKPSGNNASSMESYVGQLPDGGDVIDFLQSQAVLWRDYEEPHFILMEHIDGIEIGVGAYFNGREFLLPACIDFEHKRFFTGDLGELTGEMGTVVSYQGGEKLFSETLAKMAPALAAGGYCGYVNLNTIVNQNGIWPLEFTSRFGYPGFAILSVLQEDDWGLIFKNMCLRTSNTIRTARGYAVGVVLTVPPFPYAATTPPSPTGLNVRFRPDLSPEEAKHMHYCEVMQQGLQLVTAGVNGQVMVVTGRGETVKDAKTSAYSVARKISVPNLRYRTDIGDRFIAQDETHLKLLGILPSDGARD